jgi:hypothetical protein
MPVSAFDMAVHDFEAKKSRSVSPVSSTTASTMSDLSPLPVMETMQDLILIGFSRCPREFRAGLLEGPQLRETIAAMQAAGQSVELETGTKLFCKPECYTSVRKAIQRMETSLRPYHVIVTGDLRHQVMEVVKAFPRALKVKCKEETVIARVGLAGKWLPMHQSEAAAPAENAGPATVQLQLPKSIKAKTERGAETDFIGARPIDNQLALESFLPPFPMPAVEPALAFPIYPSYPALPEVDPALVMHFMQEMEKHQKMIHEALLLSTQVDRTSPDFAFIAEQQR